MNKTKQSEEQIVAVCKYCGRKYKYAAILGDMNMGACFRSACILASMREHL